MKIIEPSFKLYTTMGKELTPEDGITMLKWIEANARISHKSEFQQTDHSWQRFIQAVVLDHGDYSVIEHAPVTAILRIDRGVLLELTRHRLFSFTVESTRFINGEKKYNGNLEFIKPVELPDIVDDNSEPYIGSASDWRDSLAASESAYFRLLHRGAKPQEARSVLPNALACTVSMTGNLRNWRLFFLMRSTKESHPDMRRIVVPILGEFQRCIPLLFTDITPLERQIENLRKPR